MLDAAAPHQILARGQGWSSIVSGDASKGSRLEKVVARLCRCGITTVMQARRRDESCEKPRQRGAKRASTLAGDQDGSVRARDGTGINAVHPEEEHEAVWPDADQGLEQASMQSIPKMQEVGGVRGRYLPQAMLLPQEHAIALTIGRIIIWGTVNAIPQRTLEGLAAQISLTSANLGEKYHGAWFASIFSGMATLMCERLTRSRFNDPPMNLPFPSAFRVVWDGITLQNGATVIPIIVVFTDYTGRIVSELVDAPISKGSSGMDVAALVHGVLERKLSISKKVLFRSGSSGASQASMQRERMSGRCDLLTSMLVDRAYSGKTGNKSYAFFWASCSA